jgi:uncharacterized protein
MSIEFDSVKRDWTLKHRGVDFKDAQGVLDGLAVNSEDTRRNYGERRYITLGVLQERVVVVVWTNRIHNGQQVRRIISMRKANDREIEAFWIRLREDGRDTGRA